VAREIELHGTAVNAASQGNFPACIIGHACQKFVSPGLERLKTTTSTSVRIICISVDSLLAESTSATGTARAISVAVSSSVRRCGGHSVYMSQDGNYVGGLMNGFGRSIITRNSLSAANRNPRFCFDLVWGNCRQCSITGVKLQSS
jgi:hypothetical protein